LQAGARIPMVFTQPDRPAGRGRRIRPSAIKRVALEAGVAVDQPLTFADRDIRARWMERRPDLLVVVAYGLILPAWFLDWPRCGAINVHASLLPRWRGAAPIQRAILAGDDRTGVSIMKMDAGLDTGPVYATETVPITRQTTAGMLHDQLADLGAELLIRSIDPILSGSLAPVAQPEDGVTYAHKLHKSEAHIDWHQPAVVIDRKIRALNPWPIAETRLSDGRRLRIWEAEVANIDVGATPGAVLAADSSGIVIAAGTNAIRLRIVQAPSGKAIDAGAYLAARPLNGADFAI
jgi:methionyl-tRNA formyltransferase